MVVRDLREGTKDGGGRGGEQGRDPQRVDFSTLGSYSLIGQAACKHVTTSPQHVCRSSHPLINCHAMPLFCPMQFSFSGGERMLWDH